MNMPTFLSALEPFPARALIFDLGEQRVSSAYHLTEVKAVNVSAMECGASSVAWSETISQLWTPDKAGDFYMNVYMNIAKFLAIYRRVAAHLPLDDEAEVRVEYGTVGRPAISYLVSRVDAEPPHSLWGSSRSPSLAKPTTVVSGSCPP